MALTIEQVTARVDSLRYRNHERDARNLDDAFADQWQENFG